MPTSLVARLAGIEVLGPRKVEKMSVKDRDSDKERHRLELGKFCCQGFILENKGDLIQQIPPGLTYLGISSEKKAIFKKQCLAMK